MSKNLQEPASIWRQFLSLGEDLLSQSDTASICRLLKDRVSTQFNCQVELFLAEPSYPLPGEAFVPTIPSIPCPEIVKKVYRTKTAVGNNAASKTIAVTSKALPLITQETLLAVLLVERPEEDPFSTQELELLDGIASYAAISMQITRQVTLKNWRYDQISLVRSVSSQIANVLNLDELCQRVTRLIQTSFNYYFVSIFTLEPKTELLHFRASSSHGQPGVNLSQVNIELGKGLIGTSAAEGKEHISRDVTKDPTFQFLDLLPDTRAEAVLPIMIENRVLGVLDVQSDRFESFHESDMLVLRSLADNIALAVEGARLYNDLERRAEQMNAILEVNYAVSSILDLESLLEEVVNLIHDRFNYPFVHIFTVHTGRRKVIYQAGSGQRSRHLRMNSFAYDLDAPKGIIPYVARTGKPILVNDIEKEPLYLPSKLPPHDTQSEMTIPLLFGTDVLGVLDIQSDKANSFDELDLELFEGLASGIAIAVRNATLFRSEKWRRQISDSFQDVAGLLSANIELSDLFDRILSELEKDLPCDASAIWLLDEKPEKVNGALPLRLAAVHGVSRQRVIKSRLDSEEVRQSLDHSLDKMTPTIRAAEGPYGPLGLALNFPSNYSSIAVPLRAGENVLGVLTLAHHQDGRYGSEASAISSTFANYAAIAIQNAKLFAAAQKEAWSSTVLLQVAEAAQSITSEEELLNTMCRLTPLLVGIDQCAFYLFNENQESFEMRAWYGFHPGEDELLINVVDSLPLLKLKATASTIFVQDPVNELKLPSLKHSEEVNTVVLLPLLARDEVLGAFLISHRADTESGAENRIKDQTLAILQGISQQTSVALENIHLVETRQEEAYITAVLLQVSQAVVTQNNLQDILDTIVHLMPILVGIETCVIYLWDKSSEKFSPSQAIAPNHLLHQYLEEKSFIPGEYPLLDELRETQKMVFCQLENPDLPPDDWTKAQSVSIGNIQTDLMENGSNWLIGLPLSVKGEFFGGLVAIEKEVPPRFQAKRIELLNGVAQQIALAVQDDRLKQEMIGQERMAKEMQLAKEIQKSFFPDELPNAEGWNFDLRWNTAREVGGDFYDVFMTHDNRIAFSIADVSDKGMPAALYMTVTRTLVRASAQSLHSPARVLERVNELLVMDSKDNGMFITAVLAYLDPKTGDIEYAIAGHNLPLHYQAANAEIARLNKDGIALGVIEEAKYRDQSLKMASGDSLILYTDGVTETFSPEGKQFGEDGLIQTLQKVIKTHPRTVLTELDEQLKKFRVTDELSDDVTLILIQRK